MLLDIERDDACLGMFIHGFGKQWMSSPFVLSQFKLTNPDDLKALRESSIRTLTIDLSKGVGPTSRAAVQPKAQEDPVAARVSAALAQTTGMVRSIFRNAASPTGIDRRQADAVVDVVDQLINIRPNTLVTLTKLKTKDEVSFQHSVAVCALVGLFARHLKLDSELVRVLSLAGLLHDIGKVRIPTAVLAKNGTLTAEEMAVMQSHPRKGYEMLTRGSSLPDIVGKVCLHHHERIDGSGYPNGLKNDEVNAAVRMVAICDVFDALTSIRPYKNGCTPETAAAMMATWKGHLDQVLLKQFLDCMSLKWPERRTPSIASANAAQAADGTQADLFDFQFTTPTTLLRPLPGHGRQISRL